MITKTEFDKAEWMNRFPNQIRGLAMKYGKEDSKVLSVLQLEKNALNVFEISQKTGLSLCAVRCSLKRMDGFFVYKEGAHPSIRYGYIEKKDDSLEKIMNITNEELEKENDSQD